MTAEGGGVAQAEGPTWRQACALADHAAEQVQDLAVLVQDLAEAGDKGAERLVRFAQHLGESVASLADRIDLAANGATRRAAAKHCEDLLPDPEAVA